MKSGTFTSSPASVENVLSALRILERVAADLLPVRVVAALRLRVERVDDHVELVASVGGLSETLDCHAPAAGSGDVVERASDRVIGNVREASVRLSRKWLASVGKVGRGIRFRSSAPWRCDCGSGGTRSDQWHREYGRQEPEHGQAAGNHCNTSSDAASPFSRSVDIRASIGGLRPPRQLWSVGVTPPGGQSRPAGLPARRRGCGRRGRRFSLPEG